MTPERWAAAQQLFEAALAVAESARDAFVDQAASDAELAVLVRGMLSADAAERSGGDNLAGVVSRAVEQVTGQRSTPLVERLGPYRIVSMLGEGGMGAVYLAERDDDEFLQQVAIKVVRGLLDPERVRQFRTERQILAWLEHANIARLIDGGTSNDGLPYLVMEYVQGVPIDHHCDARRLGVADRLRLFLVVCDAVSHAHRSLIVHRDIKPTNILVTRAGVPKLLDFGIARLALEGAGGEAGITRGPGRMMTPDYASPEVVRGGQVTTSADVYALGVLLYELLTGRRPLRFATMSTAEIERVVCQVEPRPASVAVAEAGPPGPTVDERAAARSTTAPRLRGELSGDLDVILATAMAKDPADRYASVEAFAADLQHHLAGRPVAARPATWAYTARRFAARHRWGAAAAALFVLVLAGAAVVLSMQAARLAEERDRTARERDTAQQVVSFLTGLFEISNPDAGAGASVTARELLDRGAERIDAELSGQPVVQARLLGTIGTVYGSLGVYDRAAALLERALELRRTTLGVENADTAQSMQLLAEALRELARLDEAETLHREALAIKRRVDDAPASIAASLNDLGLTLSERGKYVEAEPLLREAIATWRRLAPDPPADVAVGLNNLAQTLRQQGRLDEAATTLDEAIAIRRRRFGNDHPLLANVLGHLGQVRNAQGDLARAEPLLREALAIRRKAYGDDHPDTATAFNNLASLLHDAGDLEAAEPFYRLALTSTEKRLGPRHPDYAVQVNNLASLLEDRDRLDEAETLYRVSYDVRRTAFGAEHPAVARATHNLARVELALGRVAQAEPLALAALELRQRILPAGHAEIAASTSLLGELRAAQGRVDEAERLITEALETERRVLGPRHPQVAATLLKLSSLCLSTGRAAQAETLAAEAVAIRAERLPAGHWLRALSEVARAGALLALGRPRETDPWLATAVAVLARQLGEQDRRTLAAARLASRAGAGRGR